MGRGRVRRSVYTFCAVGTQTLNSKPDANVRILSWHTWEPYCVVRLANYTSETCPCGNKCDDGATLSLGESLHETRGRIATVKPGGGEHCDKTCPATSAVDSEREEEVGAIARSTKE